MADLLTELQQLGGAVTARRRIAETEPLLLDDVYTCTGPQHNPNPVGHKSSTDAGSTAAVPVQAAEGMQASSCHAVYAAKSSNAVEVSSSSFTSTNLNSLAALAAYRRQLYLGLDPPNPTAAGAAAVRPNSATAAPLQATLAGKRSFLLKSRPNGMSSPDYGASYTPGYLPRLGVQDSAAFPMPAQPGTGTAVVPPRLHPRSCCPPPWPEPLVPTAETQGQDVIAARQAMREQQPEELINRLVYDSLQPPLPGPCSAECGGGASRDSSTSSCRSTTSSNSLNTSACNGPSSGISQGAAGMGRPEADIAAVAYAPSLTPWYQPEGLADPTLVFESRFESGNLRRAVQVGLFEYDLVLQPDINTRGHTQWFYFAVSNTRAATVYRFNIINLLKEDSLYNMGMLPLMHSERQMQDKAVGWTRCGSNVCYGPNNITCRKKQTYYTLTFTVEFPHDHDLVHLAHCYPFTWTDQQNHLYVLKKCPPPDTILHHTILANSLAGNAVDLLTITAAADRGKPLSQRQGVVLSARVHPGETNASWMMKGTLQQLMADSKEAAQLREMFVFKVVPMLNPDGVIVGNYRCSLAGLDLNRVYEAPDSRLQPVICAFKDMVRAFMQEREVVLSCDMHGHSRHFGIFMYGCEKKPGKDVSPVGPGLPVPGSVGGLACIPARHQERVFPLMLALNVPDLFSYRACNFKVQKSKAGTGRVVGFRELGLVNAFTMEASFAGVMMGKYAKQHFNAGHLEQMGAAVVRTLLDYWAPPELNSASDLCAQLDAALLQGIPQGGISSSTASSTSMSTASATSPLERLGLPDAMEDEDVCTDSDDESSDDEKPNAAAASVGLALAAAAGTPARAVLGLGPASTASVTDPCSSSNSTTSISLTDISRQLADMLNSKLAAGALADGSQPAGAAVTAVGSSATAAAVKELLAAIKASECSSSAVTAGAPLGSCSSKATCQSTSSSPASTPPSNSSSSTKQVPTATPQSAAASQSVHAAAQHLLDRLHTAHAKLQAGPSAALLGAVPPQPHSSTCNVAAIIPVNSNVTPSDAASPSQAVIMSSTHSGSRADGCPVPGTQVAATVSTAAAAAGGGGGREGGLSDDEAALLLLPGLQDILQQLVQQTALQKDKAAAGGGKKKGRRKGRWGSPEVLQAARAKADAGLAAALPELGIAHADDREDAAAGGSCWDDVGCSSCSSPATPTVPEATRIPVAGRRAQTAGSSKGSSLNVERYMYCLEVQKRALGGVLASSSTDCAWGVSCNSPPSSNNTDSRLLNGITSTSSKVVMTVGTEVKPDSLQSVVPSPTAELFASRDELGAASLQRRSKSAHP